MEFGVHWANLSTVRMRQRRVRVVDKLKSTTSLFPAKFTQVQTGNDLPRQRCFHTSPRVCSRAFPFRKCWEPNTSSRIKLEKCRRAIERELRQIIRHQARATDFHFGSNGITHAPHTRASPEWFDNLGSS